MKYVIFTPKEVEAIKRFADFSNDNVVVVCRPSSIGDFHYLYNQRFFINHQDDPNFEDLGVNITDYESL